MATWHVPFRGQMTMILAFVLALGMAPGVPAAPGDLDPTFDGDGKAITDLGTLYDSASAMTLDSLGRIVVVGASDNAWALARYNPDGTPDTSFGQNGFVIPDPFNYGYANGVAVDNAGRILIAGIVGHDTFGCTTLCGALARYNDDGSLDTSFDGDGLVISEAWTAGLGVAVDSAGRIVVAAASGAGSTVARYLSNGALDTSFGSGGLVSTAFAMRGILLDTAGRIVTTGYTGSRPTRDIVTARFLANGSPDTSFDNDGQAVTDFTGANDEGYALAVDGSGRIVVGGRTGTSPSQDFAVVRYTPGGALDATFDGDGRVTTDFAGTADTGYAVMLDASGRIVVAGSSAGAGFPVARYTPNGALDPTFDGDGRVTTGATGVGRGAALDGAGRIVVAGTTWAGENASFALVSYTPGGALDMTFDDDGLVTTDFPGGADAAHAVALYSADRIVVAGSGGNDFALARYTADGALDRSFGNNGAVTTDVVYEQQDAGRAIAVDAAGRIVVAGYTGSGSGRDFAVVRYNPDGSLDTRFGGDGKVTTDFNGWTDLGYAVAIDAQGRIVVAGSAGTFALARYNPDGSLDTSFDGDGKVTTACAGHGGNGRAMAIDRLGRIVVAGQIYTDSGSFLGLARYNPDGALDLTFGGDGWVITDLGNGSAGENIAIDGLDRIMVVGSTTYPNQDMAVARYTSDGSLDTTFDGDGIATADFAGAYDYGHAVALDRRGRIVVAGDTDSNGSDLDFAVVRFNPDGSLDTSFGDDGKVTTDLARTQDAAFAMALDVTGRMVVAGEALYTSYGSDFAIVRYLGDAAIRNIYMPVVSRP